MIGALKALFAMWLVGEIDPWVWLGVIAAVLGLLFLLIVLWPLVLAGAIAGLVGRFYLWRLRRKMPS